MAYVELHTRLAFGLFGLQTSSTDTFIYHLYS
jgi:hypothetical protein